MKEKIEFYISELLRLEPDFPEEWEVILRYLVKLNTVLSFDGTDITLVADTIVQLNQKLTDSDLQTIVNIYFSRIMLNRAKKLEEDIYLGDQTFRELPAFVDRSRIKTHVFESDPIFESKGIHIRGGWLDTRRITLEK